MPDFVKTETELTTYIFAPKGAELGLQRSIIAALVGTCSQAKLLCPVDKGQLANSYMWNLSTFKGGFNGKNDTEFKGAGDFVGNEKAPTNHELTIRSKLLVGHVGSNSDHWYPEFGTKYQVAQPHIRPAKEIVLGGGKADVIAKKYCRQKMEKEFEKRKVNKKVIK